MAHQHSLDLRSFRIDRHCLTLILPVALLLFSISASPAWAQAVAEAPLKTEALESETEVDESDTDTSNSESTTESASTAATTGNAPVNVDINELLFNGEAPKTIEELRAMEAHFAELAEKVKPAVVNIRMAGSQGSGVVISSDGYVLTAAHVIGNPNGTALLTFPDGKEVTAKTLGIHRSVDSGMLKIQPSDDKDEDDEEGNQEEEITEYPYLDLGLSA